MTSETVRACPHCDSAGSFYKRSRSNTSADDPSKPFHCGKCCRSFDEPVEREPYASHVPGPNGPNIDPELLDRVREKMGIEVDG